MMIQEENREEHNLRETRHFLITIGERRTRVEVHIHKGGGVYLNMSGHNLPPAALIMVLEKCQ